MRNVHLIKVCRYGAGITQKELAHDLHVSPLTIHRWERGGVSIEYKHAIRLHKLFDIDPAAFMTPDCNIPLPDHVYGLMVRKYNKSPLHDQNKIKSCLQGWLLSKRWIKK